MSQIEVSYDESRERIVQELRKQSRLYLATADLQYVTVRYMGFVSEGLTMWFRTDRRTRKHKQIAANPNVAIAGPDLQIEGVATLKGHPLDEENSEFQRVYRKLHPEV